MDEQLHNRIDSYVRHSMSEEDRAQFEADLKSDAALQEAYDEFLFINSVIEYADEDNLRAEMKSWKPNSGFNRYWMLATLIAAIIVISIASYVQTNKIDRNQFAEQYALHDIGAKTRGPQDEKLLKIQAYESIMKEANSFRETKDFPAMRKSLEKIDTQYPIFAQNKEWMLCLSYYLEHGRKNKDFQAVLNKILDQTDHNCYKLAVDLDQRVNGFWGRLKG